ncbi:cathepsin L1-like [Cimex lectularius]|uniref:Peptidase C1A papain C-terminal domain-containing protein n=1 Tax=Cimex lectularius TaxID=79782 RepID=A0A8I6SUN1_CIMLE|nr:cathepsin L1-like [Cimex lectularius]
MITSLLLVLTFAPVGASSRHLERDEKSDEPIIARKISLHDEEVKKGGSYNLLSDLSRSNKIMKVGEKISDESILRRRLRPRISIPKELDWRKRGFVTPSWNQKNCSACYAFSVAASIQAQMFIKRGKYEPLSKQQIVDCSYNNGNLGCNGGTFLNTLLYVQRHGLMTEKDYPYDGNQSACRFESNKVSAKIKFWNVLPAGDEDGLKTALANYGPIPVAINSRPETFKLYEKGIYDDPECTGHSMNHAVLLVGYTEDAWIIKNWWSDEWGESGYMYLKRGKNMCGISNYAVYVKA